MTPGDVTKSHYGIAEMRPVCYNSRVASVDRSQHGKYDILEKTQMTYTDSAFRMGRRSFLGGAEFALS